MANIDLTALEDQKKRQFATAGSGGDRFTKDFVDSVNESTSMISVRCDLETRIPKIQSPADIIQLSDEYLHVLSHLVTIGLIEKGQRPARGQEVEYESAKRQAPRLIDQIRWDIQNQAQEADTDDTSDFAALGGLGG